MEHVLDFGFFGIAADQEGEVAFEQRLRPLFSPEQGRFGPVHGLSYFPRSDVLTRCEDAIAASDFQYARGNEREASAGLGVGPVVKDDLRCAADDGNVRGKFSAQEFAGPGRVDGVEQFFALSSDQSRKVVVQHVRH